MNLVEHWIDRSATFLGTSYPVGCEVPAIDAVLQ